MGRPYSLDLRERVVAAMTAGMSGQKAAQHFSIGESSALRWARRARETGSPKAKPMGGTRPFVLEAHRRWIVSAIFGARYGEHCRLDRNDTMRRGRSSRL